MEPTTALEKLTAILEGQSKQIEVLTAGLTVLQTQAAPAPITPPEGLETKPAKPATEDDRIAKLEAALQRREVADLLRDNKVPAAYASLLADRDPEYVKNYLNSDAYKTRKSPATKSPEETAAAPEGAGGENTPGAVPAPDAAAKAHIDGKFNDAELTELGAALGLI